MTDGLAPEPPRGTPDKRALGAMESAVWRVREAQGTGPVSSDTVPEQGPPSPVSPPGAPAPAPPVPPAAVETGASEGRGRLERWLVAAVSLAAALVLFAAVALAASLTSSSSPTVPTPAGHALASPTTGQHTGTGGTRTRTPATGAGPGPSSGARSSTTTTPAGPAPSVGGVPVISALNPATGTPGQGIAVAGANFLSSDGLIVATFNGRITPTSCPTQSVCTVTVPPPVGSSTAEVTITTATGTSNAVIFVYS